VGLLAQVAGIQTIAKLVHDLCAGSQSMADAIQTAQADFDIVIIAEAKSLQ
jgi:hypothetical protein